MSMDYIRKFYGVPAKRGMTVTFHNGDVGEIIGSRGEYLTIRVRKPGSVAVGSYHPTWGITYPETKR